MSQIGERIAEAIKAFKLKGVDVHHTNPGTHDEYSLVSKDYKVEIIVNPPQWVGLEFYWAGGERKHKFDYRIDTDLYDLSDPKNAWFAKEIEDDIVEFLEILKEGKLLVGEKNGRPALIIPFQDEILLLRGGKFWPYIQRTYKDLEKAKSGGTFRPLSDLSR